MTTQTFVTLLVTGLLTGLVATLAGKSAKTRLALNLVVAVVGAFLGWFILRQISGVAIMIGFAIGGGLLLLWLVRVIKK